MSAGHTLQDEFNTVCDQKTHRESSSSSSALKVLTENKIKSSMRSYLWGWWLNSLVVCASHHSVCQSQELQTRVHWISQVSAVPEEMKRNKVRSEASPWTGGKERQLSRADAPGFVLRNTLDSQEGKAPRWSLSPRCCDSVWPTTLGEKVRGQLPHGRFLVVRVPRLPTCIRLSSVHLIIHVHGQLLKQMITELHTSYNVGDVGPSGKIGKTNCCHTYRLQLLLCCFGQFG